MNKSRIERLAPLSGLVSVVLVILGAVIISNYDYLPPAEEVADLSCCRGMMVASER